MPHYFIIAITIGLILVIGLLLLSLLFFHTADAPATRLAAPGTIEMPLGFFLLNLTEGGFPWPLKKEKPAT